MAINTYAAKVDVWNVKPILKAPNPLLALRHTMVVLCQGDTLKCN